MVPPVKSGASFPGNKVVRLVGTGVAGLLLSGVLKIKQYHNPIDNHYH